MTATHEHATGWGSVTNVPCPGCHVGIVRWAEAGYVPGWRECDTCGRQFMGDPSTGHLTQRRKATCRVTAKRVAEVAAARAEAEALAQRSGDWLAAEAAASDLRGSYHGDQWHAMSGYYRGDQPNAGAYMAAWRIGATPAAVAALDRIGGIHLPGTGIGAWGFRFRPELAAISRDGLRVVIYRSGAGGTYIQSLDDALAGRVKE